LSRSRQADLARLIARPFAHRGLHGDGRIENSRAAFEAAIAAGHGIELDVQSSLMGEAAVFHDDELDRLTDITGSVSSFHIEELQEIKLKGGDETIPWLNDILDLVAGRVSLLIEVKSTRNADNLRRLCRSMAFGLSTYEGPVAVMSFDPRVGRWFARHAPEVLRGLVVTENGEPSRGRIKRRFARWWSSPDFLAYDIRDLPSASAQGLPVLTWTVRSQDDRVRAARHADQIIYEDLPG
jgi:glycerophosphoryl diester phosphodiesterase